MAYIKGNSVPHANLGVLDQLIASRHELAQVHCKGNSSFDNRKSLTEHFDTIHDKTHKLCGEKLLCKESVYPNHEIHICIPYGVSRINKNELKKKEKKKKNQEE
ncbi:hypothetical protein L3X38_014787 [Prunus dulcis]|uniref:Uncharacterized protein n=1 Tax=Prunus dulcis TaxID=3755 RepID=A0AAD4WNV5_PRUDU|nr:hypothetical protein L3X38_014787 [Prunus dulcis]